MKYIDEDGDESLLSIKSVSEIKEWNELTEAQKCKVYCSKIVCETNPCKKHER